MKVICLHLWFIAPIVSGAKPNVKIIGGTVAASGEMAEVVAMLVCSNDGTGSYSCTKLCSGTLVAPNLVLTAGHCVRTDPVSNIFVLVGSHSYTNPDWSDGAQFLSVVKVVFGSYGTNPLYPFDGDIALLQLERCLSLIPGRIQVAKIATKSSEPSPNSCSEDIRVAGFGRMTNSPLPVAKSDGQLRYFNTHLNSFQSCRDAYIYVASGNQVLPPFTPNLMTLDLAFTVIEDLFICTGGSSMDSACFGDSGGPTIFTKPDGTRIIVGTTSFGMGGGGFCNVGPGFATRTAFHAPWIRDQLVSGALQTCPGFNVSSMFGSWPVPNWVSSGTFNATRCALGKWQCLSGQCIDRSKVCDSKPDCSDSSDETFVYPDTGVWLCARPNNGASSSVFSSQLLLNRLHMTLNITIQQGSSVSVPKTSTAVDCTAAIAQVNSGIAAITSRTVPINDTNWNPNPLLIACGGFSTCVNITTPASKGYGSTLQFCNDLSGFVAFNQSRNAFFGVFAKRLGGNTCARTTTTTQRPTAPRKTIKPSAKPSHLSTRSTTTASQRPTTTTPASKVPLA
jgi:chymotrypsin C